MNHRVNEAENTEDKKGTVSPNHDPKSQTAPTRGKDPLDEQRQHEEDVERDGLHRVEPDEVAETGVPHDAQVEGEECHEARVWDGAVQTQKRDERVE